MPITAEERRLHGVAAAHKRYATGEPTTDAARAAFMARFEREVDPHGRLDPETRARRAEHARKRYFAELALASARARRLAKEATEGGAA
ncbi:MAG: hypothetical protein M3P53_02360 [Actinomycetota bacterium]|nr:hypothetical protein [Actinomycetota bacterium]